MSDRIHIPAGLARVLPRAALWPIKDKVPRASGLSHSLRLATNLEHLCFAMDENAFEGLSQSTGSVHILDHYKWDYGGGLRIAFSSGEVARIDVAISHENKPNLFLTFGHTF